MRYQCHYNVRHPGECDGQSGYGVKKLDGLVEYVVRMKLQELCTVQESDLISTQHVKDIEAAELRVKAAKAALDSKLKEIADLRTETIKVIRGESKLDADLLTSLIAEATEASKEAEAKLAAEQDALTTLKKTSEALQTEYKRILNWADLYDNCDLETKKMIVSQLVKAVRVYRNYRLEINFNISFEKFQAYCDTRK